MTDLHFGLDDQSWLWPKVKHDLFRDIEKMSAKVNGWDLVFFTGDFTQHGQKEEFDRLNQVLDELWKILSKSGHTPLLCMVPGNHDLVRPDPASVNAIAMSKFWWSDTSLRKKFWQEEACELRIVVEGIFANYLQWTDAISVPTITKKTGLLPGDFSATFKKGSVALGIVGLNTAFLQVTDGDFEKKLELHSSQLSAVCEGDPDSWLRKQSTNVLLTHHPMNWLAPDALDHFRQEIYSPGRFFAHYCGHQHEPQAFELSEAGAEARRLRQAASLFGMENWGETDPKKRIHGYTAGQFIFEVENGIEKRWPRVSVKRRHGGLNLAPDHSFTLQQDDCLITPFSLVNEDARNTTGELQNCKSEMSQKVSSSDRTLLLFEDPPDEKAARVRLATCPRFSVVAEPQHRHVRQDELSQFEHELRKSRHIWLIADWGTGSEGFLSAAIDRFRTQEIVPDVFHLRCDDAVDMDAFEALFPQQFGLPMQSFSSLAGQLKDSFLILDGIHPNLAQGTQLNRLKQVVSAIVDYCPDLRIILVCRLFPEKDAFPALELRPLDSPETRAYLMQHPDATPQLREADIIEKLHEQSEGLPMHLDRMLKALKVSSLASVLEAEMEGLSTPENVTEKTPKALVHAVATLSKSEDKSSLRSLRLLKVLSVLPYGETLEALSHYLPSEPFFSPNALQLKELALLDVIPLQQYVPNVGMQPALASELSAPKILKVPRQVRDYVLTLLSDEEREEIVISGIDRFFGRLWREGILKLRSLPLEYREYLSSGAGNEFTLVHHLITQGRSSNDGSRIRQAATIGIEYSEHLKEAERYKDLTLVAGALVQVLDRAVYPEKWARLAALYGTGLRMIGKRDEAMPYFKEALAVGEGDMSASEKASIWLDIALLEKNRKNNDAAIAAAKEVEGLSKKKSCPHIHALAITAQLTLKGVEQMQELNKLEKLAHAEGCSGLADTIALELSRESDSASEEIKYLNKVIAKKNHGYNEARAIVAKMQALKKLDDTADLGALDLYALSAAYSYLHAQRFSSMFDSCHNALWQLFETRGEIDKLLRLFRYSSFVWRIRGEDAKEADYLKRLDENKVQTASDVMAKSIFVEVSYFLRRYKLIITA